MHVRGRSARWFAAPPCLTRGLLRRSWHIDTKYYTAEADVTVRRRRRTSSFCALGPYAGTPQVLELPRDASAGTPTALQRAAEAVVLAYDAAEVRRPHCSCGAPF